MASWDKPNMTTPESRPSELQIKAALSILSAVSPLRAPAASTRLLIPTFSCSCGRPPASSLLLRARSIAVHPSAVSDLSCQAHFCVPVSHALLVHPGLVSSWHHTHELLSSSQSSLVFIWSKAGCMLVFLLPTVLILNTQHCNSGAATHSYSIHKPHTQATYACPGHPALFCQYPRTWLHLAAWP